LRRQFPDDSFIVMMWELRDPKIQRSPSPVNHALHQPAAAAATETNPNQGGFGQGYQQTQAIAVQA
jgi:hypothetical protein